MRQICLDTETTGFDALGDDRLVEIGCVELVGRSISEDEQYTYHVYLNPERSMPSQAFEIHGLGDEFLSTQPLFADVADAFLDFIRGSELLIHNAEFDIGFLNAELKRLKKGRIEDYCAKVTDTLSMARTIFPGLQNNLNVLCSRYDIDKSARTFHGALLDAQLLAEVYLSMTRQQGSLLTDMMTEILESVDPMPARSQLVVSHVLPDEQAAHEKMIALIDKKCKTGSLWTRFYAPKTTPDVPG